MDKLTVPVKILSGFLLILFTVLPILAIISYWPDIPPKSNQYALYDHHFFCTRLIMDSKNTCGIHLNMILFILVACSGFLGSMIHISTSFTTFVGADKFEKSWILWYCVKPFTGASLALVFYFALRAGLLNVSSDSAGSVNLYGTVALAMFTGLFTDVATQKLKEIFQVMFQPKDQRPDKLDAQTTVTSVTPEILHSEKSELIVVSGKGLNFKTLEIYMGDQVITNYVHSAGLAIAFNYQVARYETETSIALKINEAGHSIPLYTKDLKIVP